MEISDGSKLFACLVLGTKRDVLAVLQPAELNAEPVLADDFKPSPQKNAYHMKKSELNKGSSGGNTSKKRASTLGPINTPINNSLPTNDDAAEPLVIIWPEWSDVEINSEKWTTKHVFEDPEGPVLLPRSIRSQLEGFKRPAEISPTTTPIGISSFNVLETMFYNENPLLANAPENKIDNPIENALEIGLNIQQKNPSTAVLPNVTSAPVTFTSNPTAFSLTHVEQPPTPPTETVVVEPPTNGVPLVLPAPEEDINPVNPKYESTNKINNEELELAHSSDQDSLTNITSKFFRANLHLMNSELMRSILIYFHFLYDHSKQGKSFQQSPGTPADDFSPWDHIFPKGKDGFPMYNTSGKYIVKLFWLGAWRKITVDDKIPVDSAGRPLLISSPCIHEIWPLILSKALIKVASTSYKDDGSVEYGDFDVFNTFKGWLPEKFTLSTYTPSSIFWGNLCSLSLKASLGSAASVAPSIPAPVAPLPTHKPGALNNKFSSLTSINSGSNALPSYCIIFGMRDGEENNEKLDLATTPFLYRILEFKEGLAESNFLTQEGQEVEMEECKECEVKQVKLKKYFSCGYSARRQSKGQIDPKTGKPAEGKEIDGKLISEYATPSTINLGDDGTEFWISFKEFCKTFRNLSIFHNPGSFRQVKSIYHINDPAKSNDTLRIAPVLYNNENNRASNLMISLHSFGTVKEDPYVPPTTMILEKWAWKGGFNQYKSIPSDEGLHHRFVQVEKVPVLKVSTNSCSMTYVKLEAGTHAYRFSVECATSYVISVWLKDESISLDDKSKYFTDKLGLQVRDIEEPFPAQSAAGSWFVLFKMPFFIPQMTPTTILAMLYGPDSVQQSMCLRLFDNDGANASAIVEIPQVFFMLKPQLCMPNKNGYTLVADCRLGAVRPTGKWRLRIVTNPHMPIFSPERPLEGMSIKPIIQDFDDIYYPNKHNIFFRYNIKVKDTPDDLVSMQLSFSLPFVLLKLQLFDFDTELLSVKGKGVVSIHAVKLFSNFPDGEIAVPYTPKAGKVELKEGGNKPNSAGSTGSQQPPKHKYILQASMEHPIELSKYVKTPTTEVKAESERPVSRAKATGGSAKKKKAGNASTTALPIVTSTDSGTSNSTDPFWKLRLISTDVASLVVTKDTEKDDRYKSIKELWEISQPGRAARAKEVRDFYLKQTELGTLEPHTFGVIPPKGVVCKPWTILNQKPLYLPELEVPSSVNQSDILLDQILPQTEACLKSPSKGSLMDLKEELLTLIGEIKEPSEDSTSNAPSAPIPLTSTPGTKSGPNSAGKVRLISSREVPAPPDTKMLEEQELVAIELITKQPSSSNPQNVKIRWPASDGPRVLSPQEILERNTARNAKNTEFLETQKNILSARAQDREARANIRLRQAIVLEEKSKETELFNREDYIRREEYKALLLKKIDEALAKKAAMEARANRLAEIAAEGTDDNLGVEKVKKKSAAVKAK